MTPASAAERPAAPDAQLHGVRAPTTRIKVGMHPVKMVAGKPQVIVTADCGSAFLFLSDVAGGNARAVFGFEHLAHRALYISYDISFFNRSDPEHPQFGTGGGAVRFQTHWQHEVTRHTGFGDVVVFPHIKAMTSHGPCASLPTLHDAIGITR